MLQILAIQLLCWVEGGVLGVQPTGHALADDEGPAARAMIRATAVISDAPPKLGEDQDDDLICGIVLFQILHKRVQGPGEFAHQPWMRRDLSGMRVVTA